MTRNEDMLNIFPDLRKSLEKAIVTQEQTLDIMAKSAGRQKAINASTAMRIAKSKPRRVISDILSAQNPEAEMKKALAQAGPKGKDGIKRDIMNYMMNKSKSGLDEASMPVLSGKKMENVWKTEGKVLRHGFSKEEQGRIDQIIQTLKHIETPKGLPDIGEAIAPGNPLIRMVGSVAAARTGAQAGAGTSGASLKTAGIFTKTFDRLFDMLNVGTARKLLTDAVQDPELFKALYVDASKPDLVLKSDKVLQGWMAAHLIESTEKD